MKQDDATCDSCFRIVCMQCRWVASEQEVLAIQKGEMTCCPVCGWSPQGENR